MKLTVTLPNFVSLHFLGHSMRTNFGIFKFTETSSFLSPILISIRDHSLVFE